MIILILKERIFRVEQAVEIALDCLIVDTVLYMSIILMAASE